MVVTESLLFRRANHVPSCNLESCYRFIYNWIDETGDSGCLVVEFRDLKGRSMKEVYENPLLPQEALPLTLLLQRCGLTAPCSSHLQSFLHTGRSNSHPSSRTGSGRPPASPDVFFCRPLFLWMLLKMWSIPLACVQPACNNHRLTLLASTTLCTINARDILSQLPEFMVTKELASAAANTAGWCTNVGNEHGQVLVSVFTAAEGSHEEVMYAHPLFRRTPRGRLLMGQTEEANRSEIVVAGRARRKEEVLAEATAFVRQNEGHPGDQFLVLAHCKIQFAKHQGQRFLWLLENSLGYAVYLVSSITGEEERDKPLSASKHLFLRYTSQIREIGEAVEVYQKKQAMLQEAQRTGDSGCLMVEFGDFKGRSMKEVYEDGSKEAQALITYLK
ncbi:hypothetical protein CRENBAI_007037 [Crenichthys baileyi]|uniref:DUF6729 domain-containing protein n=1 Tax=Crenichthys baileyi TaxID=28760 RepID=A0AAV9RTR9_9TELE